MAKRRMFSLDIIDTDIFIDMPQSTRLLYYELCMRADDDGFVGNPKKIMKMAGCSEDDMRVLVSKRFVYPFNTGVIVIVHWKIHNYIQKDRYKETLYLDEKEQISVDHKNTYILGRKSMDTKCLHYGYTGKERKELEESKDNERVSSHTYLCHLKKESKDSFCFDCQKKNVCSNKTSEGFLKLYGKTFEEYLNSKNNHEEINEDFFYYDWLNESEEN